MTRGNQTLASGGSISDQTFSEFDHFPIRPQLTLNSNVVNHVLNDNERENVW